MTAGRVLIYRQGSLGDSIVALPCFHLIAKRFPNAQRCLLTNGMVSKHIAPAADLLKTAGLIHCTIEYPGETRDVRSLARLRRSIAGWAPDVAIYLVEGRRRAQRLRDYAFLKSSGIKTIVGIALSNETSLHRRLGPGELRESEASRLARSISELGNADLDQPESWNLHLTAAEYAAADIALSQLSVSKTPFVAFSLGTKWPTNEYGDERWHAVLSSLGSQYRSLALVCVGSEPEHKRSAAVSRNWPGPVVNLCGKLQVRESAAVLSRALLFAGHDSGPGHLAAAVGTRCVSIFSGRNLPGIWFPHGKGNITLYQEVSCQGCGLSECIVEGKRCIFSISTQSVVRACAQILDGNHRIKTEY
jgi:heptosyltransferase III